MTVREGTARPDAKGPCFIDARRSKRRSRSVTNGLDQPAAPDGPQAASAALSARPISRDEGVDASQALQRVLYRSAKQAPKRRFHALSDKLPRRDVMWRAW